VDSSELSTVARIQHCCADATGGPRPPLWSEVKVDIVHTHRRGTLAKHLENTTYIKHLRRVWKISGMLVITAIAGILHGIFPFVLKTYVSTMVHDINKVFEDA